MVARDVWDVEAAGSSPVTPIFSSAKISMPRSRSKYLILLAVVIIAGLASRRFADHLPPILSKNAGDILYATMAYLVAVLLFPGCASSQPPGCLSPSASR